MNKCKWCGTEINDCEECDFCWELRTRIERKPLIANMMIFSSHRMKQEPENSGVTQYNIHPFGGTSK